ncbi:hypothetical protein [Ralstonia pseudosolanacearum]|uniref:hypothetical protein n=1 Tax=Ralstonia pseudosolanacearum TaxID=1310165 RepID=UPI003C24D481
MQQHQFEASAQRNFENRHDVFDVNPSIGRQEQEYLFNTEIPKGAIYKQWRVNP